MSYVIAGTDLKMIYGSRFSAHNLASGQQVNFSIPKQKPGWPRGGLEAYGLLVDCEHPVHGTVPSFLKLFRLEIPERHPRSTFLIRLGLAGHHPWLFQGMPYCAIDSTLNGVRLLGHIARQIGAGAAGNVEDVSRLRENDLWNFSWEDRRRLAGHLCCAVHALERLGIVHGDLSSGNVIVGGAPDGGPAAILCDYDGFFHPSQPLLPTHFKNKPSRPVGSSGYQYPSLFRQLVGGAANPFVETDRFAMGVLIFEFMTWSADLKFRLDRCQLLDDDCISARNLSRLPRDVRALWPEGYDLLASAMAADKLSDMPGPMSWMRVLGVPIPYDVVSTSTSKFTHRPHVTIFRRKGFRRDKLTEVRLVNARGTLGPAHTDLSPISFALSSGSLTLSFAWNEAVFLRREGRQHDVGHGPIDVSVQGGDVVISNFWEFELADHP
jgi:serine/threonine protein kinase